MDLNSLRYFCTVAQEGSFSKASKVLHYAQSNLSTKISQLEQELGAVLFYRRPTGISLTPKGELLLRYAQELIRLAKDAEAAVQDEAVPSGLLKLGSMESAAVSFLPQHLTAFRNSFPNVSIQVETGGSEQLVRKVLHGELDAAIVSDIHHHSALTIHPLHKEELTLICHPELAKLTLPELLSLPLLVFPSGCSYRKHLEYWLSMEGLVPSQIYTFTSISAIIASVHAGLGTALFPKSVIQCFQGSDLAQITPPDAIGIAQTALIYSNKLQPSCALRAFADALTGH